MSDIKEARSMEAISFAFRVTSAMSPKEMAGGSLTLMTKKTMVESEDLAPS